MSISVDTLDKYSTNELIGPIQVSAVLASRPLIHSINNKMTVQLARQFLTTCTAQHIMYFYGACVLYIISVHTWVLLEG